MASGERASRSGTARSETAATPNFGGPTRRAQGVLERVVGVVQRAEHAVAVRVELRPVAIYEAVEGVLVTTDSRRRRNLLDARRRRHVSPT